MSQNTWPAVIVRRLQARRDPADWGADDAAIFDALAALPVHQCGALASWLWVYRRRRIMRTNQQACHYEWHPRWLQHLGKGQVERAREFYPRRLVDAA